MEEFIVISVGGSLIAPEEVDVNFLKKFRETILEFSKNKKFIIVCGGGKICRKYQEAARKIVKLGNEEADWIGIYATWLNALLVKTLFREIAFPEIIKNPNDKIKLKKKEKIVVAGGWKPGRSTDYDAVLLAKNFCVKKIINLTNVDYVYDKDPKKFEDARPIKEISWDNFIKLLPQRWKPGMSTPFDPVAARLAKKLKIEVAIINGKKIDNLEKYLKGEKFVGTLIKS